MPTPVTQERLDEIGRDLEVRRLNYLADTATPPNTETGAALGLAYPLGIGEFRPCTLGSMLALAWIDSPLLSGADRVSPQDIYRAAYAVGNGRAALRPLMGLDVRLERLSELRESLEQQDGSAGVIAWAQLRDSISAKAWAEFDTAAASWCEQFGPVAPVEIHAVVQLALRDGHAAIAAIGGTKDTESSAEKKTPGTTCSAGFWPWLLRTSRLLPRAYSLTKRLWRLWPVLWRGTLASTVPVLIVAAITATCTGSE